MKIVLFDPPGDVSGFNAGLAYLAGALRHAGHEVRVCDLNNDSNARQERIEQAIAWRPALAGLSIKTRTLVAAGEIAAQLKRAGIPVVGGGPEVTLEKASFLEQNAEYDYAIMGEAELSLVAFCNPFPEVDCEGIPGLCYRRDGKVRCNPPAYPKKLDELPPPDFSVFDTRGLIADRYPLVTSRGCPYDCIYCSVNKVSGRAWRYRSPANILAELRAVRKEFGVMRFVIADDNFTLWMNRAKDVCRQMAAEKLDFVWSCINGIRADRVDPELLGLMKQAGCDVIWFGIETLDPELFRAIQKGEELQSVLNAVSWARQAGLRVCGFFIAGLPGSTYAKDRETLRRARRLGLDEALWSLASPFPHTPFWDWAQAHAQWLGDYRKTSFFVRPTPLIETPDYPRAQRVKMFYLGNIQGFSYSCLFPSRPRWYHVLVLVGYLLRYDPCRFPVHVRRIFFGAYHRRYVMNFFKRLFRGRV